MNELQTDTPLVSIVVPCYHAGETIETTVGTVLDQEYQNFEIIIVDDGSTDDTPRILEKLASRDERIRFVRQENQGAGEARNHGVSLARSELIAFLDADDRFYADSLSKRVRLFLENDDPDMLGVFSLARQIDIHGNALTSNPIFDHNIPNGRLYFAAMPTCPFNPTCLLTRKSVVLEVGGFRGRSGEDYDLWFKMMRGGGYFLKAQDCVIGWTQHQDSTVHSSLLYHHRQCAVVLDRIFSPTDLPALPEFKDGFGRAKMYISLTKRALQTATMAAATGKQDLALEIGKDISRVVLEQLPTRELADIMKFAALRAVCEHKQEWECRVWPEVGDRLLAFAEALEGSFDKPCLNLGLAADLMLEQARQTDGQQS